MATPTVFTPGPSAGAPGTTGASPSSTTVSNRAALIIGFVVGGAALVALAEVMPQAAIGLTAIIGLGVILKHPNELTQLSHAFVTATGH